MSGRLWWTTLTGMAHTSAAAAMPESVSVALGTPDSPGHLAISCALESQQGIERHDIRADLYSRAWGSSLHPRRPLHPFDCGRDVVQGEVFQHQRQVRPAGADETQVELLREYPRSELRRVLLGPSRPRVLQM